MTLSRAAIKKLDYSTTISSWRMRNEAADAGQLPLLALRRRRAALMSHDQKSR